MTTLTTEAVFSDDGLKRYLLEKVWDNAKPRLAILMLAPSEASGIELDTTTQLVLNNASRLGYGGVSIVNLFATLNDFQLKQAEAEDAENINAIVTVASKADMIVYAAGVGKAKSKAFQRRQEQALTALALHEKKLHCLCGKDGSARLQHPLSPAVRTWYLSPLKVAEILPKKEKLAEKDTKATQKKKAVKKDTPPTEQNK